MAFLFPFRAYRYDTGKVGRLDDVVTQPYDKIPSELREKYLSRHPYNIVRVIKNEDYQAAGQYLRDWISQGIMVRDQAPGYYIYEQEFEFEGQRLSRLGFIALISVEDPESVVKGHENILRGPLEDRLRLIRETESNEGLIFTLYSDPDSSIEASLREVMSSSPALAQVTDDYAVIHRLWQLTDEGHQRKIQSILGGRPLYIADGHHRFQTSRLFCAECRELGWKPGAVESFDKRLVALFSMDSPALKVLPTHRAVHNVSNFSFDALLERLSASFIVSKVTSPEGLLKAVRGGGHAIGIAADCLKQLAVVAPKSEAIEDPAFMPELRGPSRYLDVNLLHEGILKPQMGIGKEELAGQKYVDYFREAAALLEAVRQGAYQAGFILAPTSLEQVREISEIGEKMPQKSTDFYPKLLTGLTLMKMEIEKG